MSDSTETTETTTTGVGRGNGIRKPVVLPYQDVYVKFSRGDSATVGTVDFVVWNESTTTTDDDGNETTTDAGFFPLDHSLSWQVLRRLADSLDEIAKAEKSGAISEREAQAAEKRKKRAAAKLAQLEKLRAEIALLDADLLANVMRSDDEILSDDDDEENDENDDDSDDDENDDE